MVLGDVTPWQLNFKFHSDGELELLDAQPIPLAKKSFVAPGSKGALVEIPIEISWLDSENNVLASVAATIPLGIRIPVGENPSEPGMLMPEEVCVLRVPGPAADVAPAQLVVSKRIAMAEAQASSRHGVAPKEPALVSPQSFLLSAKAEDSPPPSLLPAPGPTGVTKIQDNGPDGNRLVLVFVGDGYLEADILDGTYANHVSQTLAEFVKDSPWDEMMAVTSAYRIDVISNERGADYEDASPGAGGTLKDTYFNTGFWTGGIERLLSANATGRSRAFAAADSFVGAGMWDQIVMVVNSSKYGGSGGSIPVNSVHSSGPEISVHEVGHSFADLADEYVSYFGQTYPGGPPSEVNVDTDPTSPKWSIWIEPSTPLPTPDTGGYSNVVGAFKGARYYEHGIYRPWRNCTMRTLGAGFCPVCREQHLKSLFSVIDITDSVSPPTAAPVSVTSEDTLSVSPVPMNDIEYEWSIGGTVISGENAPNLTVSTSQLAAPSQQVSVTVHYASQMMRSGSPLENFSWTIDNNGVTAAGTLHWWLAFHGLSVADGTDLIDHDGDGWSTHYEYVADTLPLDRNSVLQLSPVNPTVGTLQFEWTTSAIRHYQLMESGDLSTWTPVPGYEDVAGTGGLVSSSVMPISGDKRYFRIKVWIP